jgi:DNA-binding response OmpR family regulator
MRILIAEDDGVFAFILKKELEEIGIHVDWARTGVEAVLDVLENPYDIILLDLHMPVLDGMNALRILHRMNGRIPVIVLTGDATSQEMRMSLEFGARRCFAKPFQFSELVNELDRLAM